VEKLMTTASAPTLSFDPEVAAVLAPMAEEMANAPHFEVGDVDGRRAALEPFLGAANGAQPMPTDVKMDDFHTRSFDGTEIMLRWYTKEGAATGAAAVYLHGGGMILGNVSLFDGPVARYVSASGVSMLSVEYRRAPEHPHPAPVEDAYAGLVWLAEHAADLDVEASRLAVMGDSAGGGLAAGVALVARDRSGPALVRQLLIYPMLDDRNTTPDPELVPLASWSYDDNATGWQALLGGAAGGTDVSPYAAPARVADAHGLPAAYIEVGQLDIFRDESLAYAATLSRGGVPVELHLHPGVPHEFDAIAFATDVARRATADRLRVLTSL
jgi:acetyl esterase/lipase